MLGKIKDMIPVNFALLGNPVNWVIVFLMIAIAGVGLAIILKPDALSTTEENVNG